MAGGRRRIAPAANKTVVDEKVPEKDCVGEESVIVVDDSSLEDEIAQIRGRWELASVLNFLTLFQPLIGTDLKLTAEDIENGLVTANSSLAQLHIKLLKGIPPVSKTLNSSDAWVTALCKKIAIWWPWVAEGDMPLTAANGKEISRYKELDPTKRLQILKALCEIRADQNDVVSYINDSLKNGTEISCFRKDKIGGDGKATSYWCDGSAVVGHRLYKEVQKTEPKSKMRGRNSNNLPAISLQWETVATNLEEFREVVDKLSSSKIVGEIAVGKTIETDFLPVIEKLQKKKERALKQKQRQERLLNDFRSCGIGITRACRSRRPVNYTFDDYDRAIDEALEITKKRKTEQKNEKKHIMQEKSPSDGVSDSGADLKESRMENGDSDMEADSEDEIIKNGESSDSETQSQRIQQDTGGNGDGNGDDDNDYYDSKSSDNDKGSESCYSGEEKDILSERNCSQKPIGSRWSKRLAGVMNRPVMETSNLAMKNRLRQRPTRNSALDSIVLDSEDASSSDDKNDEISEGEVSSPEANSEESNDG